MTIPNTPVPDELAEVRARIRALETREMELKALILAEPEVRTGANWIAEVKVITQDRTDIKELRACYPEAVAEHTYPQEIKRIVLSGISEDGEIVPARRMKEQAA